MRWTAGLCLFSNLVCQAEEWDLLYDVMSDLEFIKARCKAGSGYSLIDDYTAALADDKEGRLPGAFAEFAKFYTANVHVIVPHPDQAITRAATYPTESAVAKAVWRTRFDVPFLQWVNKPQGKRVLFAEHIDPVGSQHTHYPPPPFCLCCWDCLGIDLSDTALHLRPWPVAHTG